MDRLSPVQVAQLVQNIGFQTDPNRMSFGLQLGFMSHVSPDTLHRMSEAEAKAMLYRIIVDGRIRMLEKIDQSMIGLGVKL